MNTECDISLRDIFFEIISKSEADLLKMALVDIGTIDKDELCDKMDLHQCRTIPDLCKCVKKTETENRNETNPRNLFNIRVKDKQITQNLSCYCNNCKA